jgi:hypothetical protein
LKLKWLFPVLILGWCGVAHSQLAVCARVSTTLRKGPGPNFEKTWSVSKFMPFVKGEQKNGWLKLTDLEGEVHWGRASDFTTALRCVVVKQNSIETRQGPGPQFPYGDFKTIDRYTPLKRYESKNGWVEVENDLGIKSWVQESKVWHPVKIESVKF